MNSDISIRSRRHSDSRDAMIAKNPREVKYGAVGSRSRNGTLRQSIARTLEPVPGGQMEEVKTVVAEADPLRKESRAALWRVGRAQLPSKAGPIHRTGLVLDAER